MYIYSLIKSYAHRIRDTRDSLLPEEKKTIVIKETVLRERLFVLRGVHQFNQQLFNAHSTNVQPLF
jgi:hypothetical protein